MTDNPVDICDSLLEWLSTLDVFGGPRELTIGLASLHEVGHEIIYQDRRNIIYNQYEGAHITIVIIVNLQKKLS